MCQLVNANAAGNQTRRDNDPARLTRDMRRVMGPVSSPMLLLCCESFPMLELARYDVVSIEQRSLIYWAHGPSRH